jgi:4-hydroxy-2-oxoheptanedioate aldolase
VRATPANPSTQGTIAQNEEREMKANALKQKIADGVNCVGGWVAIPNPFAAEIYAAQGWDSVTIDMQHGSSDINDVVPVLQAIQSSSQATPLVRVPWNDPGHIMRVLDAGAMGIICPMINTKAEAEALVRAGRYPPMGERSFGPFRASQYGADYWQKANEEVLLLAMIETRAGVNNLDEILAVKGISGVYVGPSDLSLSLGKAPTLDPTDKEVLAAIDTIVKTTRKHGLIAGVHTDGPVTALRRYEAGFQLCVLLNDVRLLAVAAQQVVNEVRGKGPAAKAKTY